MLSNNLHNSHSIIFYLWFLNSSFSVIANCSVLKRLFILKENKLLHSSCNSVNLVSDMNLKKNAAEYKHGL